MKILITGGSGFLGRRAAAHLAGLEHTVLTPSHNELDITDAAAVLPWFQTHRPDAVIHCAAVSDTGLCQKDPEGSAVINVAGSANIAAACAEVGAKLLLCSSDQVYAGSTLSGPHAEDEPLTPGNEYARQKLEAEERCAALCSNTVSLRLSWMYALNSFPGEHGHLLTNLRAALKDPTLPLTWPIHDRRGITDAACVAANLPIALTFPAGVYNFGAENDDNTYRTIRSVLERLQLEEPLTRLVPNLQAFANAPRDIRMRCDRAASLGARFPSTQEGLYQALAQSL